MKVLEKNYQKWMNYTRKHLMRKIDFIVILIYILSSCTSKSPEVRKYSGFKLLETNDENNNYDICIVYKSDSIFELIKSKEKVVVRKEIFKQYGKSFYQNISIGGFENSSIDTINVLMFSIKKDTIFEYVFDLERYPPVVPLGSEDRIIEIQKLNDTFFVTTRISKIKPSDRDVFVYDKYYNIWEVISMRGDYVYKYVTTDGDTQSNQYKSLRNNKKYLLLTNLNNR